MTSSETCKCCNEYTYNRRCDIVRHIKKCDGSVLSYDEYLMKYVYPRGLPKCLECDSTVTLRKGRVGIRCNKCATVHYHNTLSKRAIERFSDPISKKEIINKRIATNLVKYGTEYASQSQAVKLKTIDTNVSRYGTNTTLQLSHVLVARQASLQENEKEINRKRSEYWTKDNVENAKSKRKNTVLSKYGVEFISSVESIRAKISESAYARYSSIGFKQFMIEQVFNKYGVTSVSKLKWVQDKIVQTSIDKFGATSYLSSDMRRHSMEQLGKWMPLEELPEFTKYYRKCMIETNKHKKQLFNEWDGTCYYSGGLLSTNSEEYNEPNYRTIDHKKSIFYGYVNEIPYDEIGNISNLCICSRSINSRKNIKCSE